MAKKKLSKVKASPRKVGYRHFRPSYNAHPVVHLITVLVAIVLLSIILSYILFGAQNPSLFA